METIKLYDEEPLLSEFSAVLVSARKLKSGWSLVLDRTAFYPTGGGQPSDKGWIEGIAVTGVEMIGGEILHGIEGAPPGPEGASVSCKVDWARRSDFMQQHTGQHLISAGFLGLFGYDTVSVHLGETYTSVELDAHAVSPEQLRSVEELANAVIRKDVPVRIKRVTPADAAAISLRKAPPDLPLIRLVEIEGVDICACGGTHVASTGEIGLVKAAGCESIRGHVRVMWKIGGRAYRDYQEKSDTLAALAAAFGCGEGELRERASFVAAEMKERTAERGRLERKLASAIAAQMRVEIAAKAEAAARNEGASAKDVRASVGVSFYGRQFDHEDERLVSAVIDVVVSDPNCVACFVNDTGEKLRLYVAIGDKVPVAVSDLVAKACELAEARGGGKGKRWQGASIRRDAGTAFIEAVRHQATADGNSPAG